MATGGGLFKGKPSPTYRQNALSSGKDWLYGYDKLARLVSSGLGALNENKNGLTSTAFREQWGLSPVGNWGTYKRDSDGSDPWAFEQARSHNDVNEIDTTDDHSDARGEAISGSGSANWIDPKYDAAGNMSLTPRPGDESTANQALLLVYDPWNRPVKVYRDSDGDGLLDLPGDTLIAAYAYDGLNRRVKKVVEGDPDVTYDYYYNTAWQVLEVRKSGNSHPFEQYAWSGRYIDAPIVRWQDADDDGDLSDTDETLYYLTDANMNVTCLADTSGAPRERYAYEPYGKLTCYDGTWGSRGTSSYANDILYGGYRHDTETGLYHVRNRYYHPTLGRWGQREPGDQYGDEMALCDYVLSRPTGALDPMGEQAWAAPYKYAMSCDPIGRQLLQIDAEAKKRADAQYLEYMGNAQWQFKLEADARARAAWHPGRVRKWNDQEHRSKDLWEKEAAKQRKWALGWLKDARRVSGQRPTPTVFAALEVGFLVAYGRTSVRCSDECGCPRVMNFEKYCLGGVAGASVTVGGIKGLDGKDCRPERYSHWFFETGVTAAGLSVGVDVGLAGPRGNPWNIGEEDHLSGVIEGGAGLGVGARIKVGTFCWYRYLGDENKGD